MTAASKPAQSMATAVAQWAAEKAPAYAGALERLLRAD